MSEFRTIWPTADRYVEVIDQRKLPHEYIVVKLTTYKEAEMAIKANFDVSTGQAKLPEAILFFFGEDQARYLIAAPFAEAEKIVAEARAAYIPVTELGKTGGDAIIVNDKDKVALSKLRAAHEGWFPRFMSREEIPVTN